MSLFFAHGIAEGAVNDANPLATPITKAVIDAVNNQVQTRALNVANLCDVFGILAGIAYHSVAQKKCVIIVVVITLTARSNMEPQFFLRVMTTSILFYDHICPTGAFSKDSKLSVRASVKLIQTHGAPHTNSFLNTLRFASVHLNDETTPKATKLCLGS